MYVFITVGTCLDLELGDVWSMEMEGQCEKCQHSVVRLSLSYHVDI